MVVLGRRPGQRSSRSPGLQGTGLPDSLELGWGLRFFRPHRPFSPPQVSATQCGLKALPGSCFPPYPPQFSQSLSCTAGSPTGAPPTSRTHTVRGRARTEGPISSGPRRPEPPPRLGLRLSQNKTTPEIPAAGPTGRPSGDSLLPLSRI